MTLMTLSFLLSLQACSSQPTTNQQVILVQPPVNLLSDPCNAVEAGETLKSLASAYMENTSCVGEYRIRMQKLREWNQEQSVIYNKN